MIALAAVLLAAAMSMTQATGSGPRTIEKGDQSNIEDAKQVLVRTEAEWTQLYRQHNFDKPAPKIDFSKEMIVAVFMGSRPPSVPEIGR